MASSPSSDRAIQKATASYESWLCNTRKAGIQQSPSDATQSKAAPSLVGKKQQEATRFVSEEEENTTEIVRAVLIRDRFIMGASICYLSSQSI